MDSVQHKAIRQSLPMRVDAGIKRLQSVINDINSKDNNNNYLNSICNSPPLCVGYFNVTSSAFINDSKPTQNVFPLSIEKFKFSDGRGILIHRIVILAKDETLLNGSVIGRSNPAPSNCQISAWCSDVRTVRSRFTLLSANPVQSDGSSVFLFPPSDLINLLVTDCILLQGFYERLTVCIFGWPVDLENDERFSAVRRVSLSDVSRFVSRPPFSTSYPDICPSDASNFENQLSSYPPPIPQPLSIPSHSPIDVNAYIQESNFHRLLMSDAASENILEVGATSSITEDVDNISTHKRRKHRIPPVQVIQSISCEALYYLQLFEASCLHSETDCANNIADLTHGEKLLLQSSTWCSFLALLFWPFEHSATYQRLHELHESLNFHQFSSIPEFCVSSASSDQRVLCLQLLSSCLSVSLSFLRLFLRLDGHWGAALLAELNISAATLAAVSKSSLVMENAITKCTDTKLLFGAAPRSSNSVKMAALQVLSVCSTRRLGIEAIVNAPVIVPASLHAGEIPEDIVDSSPPVESRAPAPSSSHIPVDPQTSDPPAPDSNELDESFVSQPPNEDADTINSKVESKTLDDSIEAHSIYECLIISSMDDRVTFSRVRYHRILQLICHRVKIYLSLRFVHSGIKLLMFSLQEKMNPGVKTEQEKNLDSCQVNTTIEQELNATDNSPQQNPKSSPSTENIPESKFDYNAIRISTALVLEGLCCLSSLSQWSPVRQQEQDEIGSGFKATFNSRLSRSTQVGSYRGERNDGFGPDNHFSSIKKSNSANNESNVEHLLYLAEGTSLIEDLVCCFKELTHFSGYLHLLFGKHQYPLTRSKTSLVKSRGSGTELKEEIECLIDKFINCSFPESINIPNKTIIMKNLIYGVKIFDVFYHQVTIDGPMFPQPFTLGLNDLVRLTMDTSYELMSWIFHSRYGITSILLHYTSSEIRGQKSEDHTEVNQVECHKEDLGKQTEFQKRIKNRIMLDLPRNLQDHVTRHITADNLIKQIRVIHDEHTPINDDGKCSIESSGGDKKRMRSDKETIKNQSIKISLQLFVELNQFIACPDNTDAFITLITDDSIFLIGLIFVGLVKCRFEVERMEVPDDRSGIHPELLFDISFNEENSGTNHTDNSPKKHLVTKEISLCGILAALRFMTRILWKLFSNPNSNKLISILSPIIFDSLKNLRQLSTIENVFGSNEFDNQQSLNEVYGISDLTSDVYDNLDVDDQLNSRNSSGGVGMLKSLLPSSNSTNLRQVFCRDSEFRHEIADLFAAVQLSLNGEKVFLGGSSIEDSANELINGAMDPNTDFNNMINSPITESAETVSPDSLLPSHSNLITFLSLMLNSYSTLSPPYELVPISESVQIAATAAAGNPVTFSPTISEKFGGYSGQPLGVPVIDLRFSPRLLSPRSNQDMGLSNPSPTLLIVPPSVPLGWLMQTHTCLRMLLSEVHIYSPSNDLDELLDAINPDEVACALKSSSFDSPIISLQGNSQVLRRSLSRILLRCSAALFPSVHHLGFVNGEMDPPLYHSWKQSASQILPITECALLLLYELLDVCLPASPYPLSPATNLRPSHRFLCSVSRFSSTTGCSWTGGHLVDSTLINALTLLLTRLTQSLMFFDSHVDLSSTALSDSLLYNRDSLANIFNCIDITSSILRLWSYRCPDIQPTLLTTAIRHSRGSPSSFATGPLIFAVLGGLGSILPSGECSFKFSSYQPPLVAPELNGAEGRNLEAVVARLKQQYLQKRHSESLRSGVGTGRNQTAVQQGSGGGGKLPASMTTLTLSSKCRLPQQIQESLFGIGGTHYLICQIPLTPPTAPTTTGGVLPTLTATNACHSGPAGYSWIRKRLGRITMADDLISTSIFNPDRCTSTLQTTTRPTGPDSSTSVVATPEWASFQHLKDLLHNSIEEDAIESLYGSDRVPVVPLGLSAATMTAMTESRVAANELLSLLKEDTEKTASGEEAQIATEGRQELGRLENLILGFRDLKTEDLSELVELLIESSFTSDTLLHSAAATAIAISVWTHSPPIFDLILHAATTMVQNLSAFLATELSDDRCSNGVSQLFLLTRLFIFIDNVFSLFPSPTLEASSSLIRLSTAGLEALQAVPIIDPSCPTYPVLRGLFDCLLPAATRLFRSGIQAFFRFICLLGASPVEQLNLGLVVPPQTTSGPLALAAPQMSAAALLALKSQGVTPTSSLSRNPARFCNIVIADQFRIVLRRSDIPATQSSATVTQPQPGTPLHSRPTAATQPPSKLDLINGILSGIRSSCSGLSAILNQLPVAWDVLCRTNQGLDPLSSIDSGSDWSGLSLQAVADILDVLHLLTKSKLFCASSLYKIPDAFLEKYLDTVHSAQTSSDSTSKSKPVSISILNPLDTFIDSSIAVGGTPDPAIKLDAFIHLTCDALKDTTKSILDVIQRQKEVGKEVNVIGGVASNLFNVCGFVSAELLLPLVTSEPVTPETFGKQTIKDSHDDSPEDATAAELYNDIGLGSEQIQTEVKPNTDTSPPKPLNLRESFLKELLSSLESLEKANAEMNSTIDASVFKPLDSISTRINELKTLRQFVLTSVTLSAPPLILTSSHLIEPELLEKLDPVIINQHFIDDTINLAFPFCPGLPSQYPIPLTTDRSKCQGGSTALTVIRLASQMNSDRLWRSCTLLDSVPTKSTDGFSHRHGASGDSFFLCLTNLIRAYETGQTLPSTGAISSFFEELRHTKMRGAQALPNTSQPFWNNKDTYQPPPIQRPPPGLQPQASDPFRSRRGPSSRAPSKHVDEYEAAQQAKQVVGTPSNANPDEQNPEAALEQIPEWNEFVASGNEQGIDVMAILEVGIIQFKILFVIAAAFGVQDLQLEILDRIYEATNRPDSEPFNLCFLFSLFCFPDQSPQLLQNPLIEGKFRSLIDAHPSINALFKMMELDL